MQVKLRFSWKLNQISECSKVDRSSEVPRKFSEVLNPVTHCRLTLIQSSTELHFTCNTLSLMSQLNSIMFASLVKVQLKVESTNCSLSVHWLRRFWEFFRRLQLLEVPETFSEVPVSVLTSDSLWFKIPLKINQLNIMPILILCSYQSWSHSYLLLIFLPDRCLALLSTRHTPRGRGHSLRHLLVKGPSN
jgi:hypothetical protein